MENAELTEDDYIDRMVTVGIFWAAGDLGKPDIVFDSETYPVDGTRFSQRFINYSGWHFYMWDKLAAKQCGGKYKNYDCYYFPRGRVLYDCKLNTTLVYADKKILERLDIFEPLLKDIFKLEDYQFAFDEHYQSAAEFEPADMLEYKILRGADKIGANLLEFSRGGTKILVEFGRELDNESGGLTAQEREIVNAEYNAAVISHYHGDHAANIAELGRPVYMGAKCKALMETLAEYTHGKMPERIRTFRDGIPFLIGSVKITPYLCDHSAADSYMLLFEGDGRRILYTGDFRCGGRKSFDKLLRALPSGVDVLITEATNVGRAAPTITEAELEEKAAGIMLDSYKPVFILQSSMNIDSLVSFYRAAKRTGRRFYIDDYQAQICKAAGGGVPRPDVFSGVYAFAPRVIKDTRYKKFNKIKNKISRAAIAKQNRYTMLVRCSHLDLIKSLSNKADLSGAVLIYSLWEGYKARDEMKVFLNEIAGLGMETVSLHTSGHADKGTIDKLIERVSPTKTEYIHCSLFGTLLP